MEDAHLSLGDHILKWAVHCARLWQDAIRDTPDIEI